MFPFVAGLYILLGTVDFSLESDLAFNPSAGWWTPWYYKVGPLSAADWILVSIAAVTLVGALLRLNSRWQPSPYFKLIALAVAYLLIGIVYNLLVFADWKTYLYDVKVVLYLAVPYLFLQCCATPRQQRWFTPPRLVTIGAVAVTLDWVLVNLRHMVEYPSLLGLPPILEVVPLPVSVIGFVYSRRLRWRLLFATTFTVELVSEVNRLALGSITAGATAIALVLVLPHLRSRGVRFAWVLGLIVTTNLGSVYLLANPAGVPLLSSKVGGAATRVIQMQDVLLNYDSNLPIWLGKGLGSTWFEYVPLPRTDIYSVGTSLGPTADASFASNVKFIFNFQAAALLYKWGVLGGVALAWLLSSFYDRNRRRLANLGLTEWNTRQLHAALLLALTYAYSNFVYVGIVRASLVTGLMAFYIEHQIRRREAATGRSADRDNDSRAIALGAA